jgi:hypothetical protein
MKEVDCTMYVEMKRRVEEEQNGKLLQTIPQIDKKKKSAMAIILLTHILKIGH